MNMEKFIDQLVDMISTDDLYPVWNDLGNHFTHLSTEDSLWDFEMKSDIKLLLDVCNVSYFRDVLTKIDFNKLYKVRITGVNSVDLIEVCDKSNMDTVRKLIKMELKYAYKEHLDEFISYMTYKLTNI